MYVLFNASLICVHSIPRRSDHRARVPQFLSLASQPSKSARSGPPSDLPFHDITVDKSADVLRLYTTVALSVGNILPLMYPLIIYNR